MSVIGQDTFTATGQTIFWHDSDSTTVSLPASIPSTHEPVITVQVIHEQGDDGSVFLLDSFLANQNTFLATSSPTHDGLNWSFTVHRSVGDGTTLTGITRFAWKAVAVKNLRKIGASVTPATEA